VPTFTMIRLCIRCVEHVGMLEPRIPRADYLCITWRTVPCVHFFGYRSLAVARIFEPSTYRLRGRGLRH